MAAVVGHAHDNGCATKPAKKVPRRSSKPIINWLQRKLAGSGKSKIVRNGRTVSSPLPALAKQQSRAELASIPKRKARSISLNGDDDLGHQSYGLDDDLSDQFSLNRHSSAFEADDDASLRPLPPSAPPSPSPSRDSSSYLSDPRTFRSMAASTKPTTLLSIDLNVGGMAHIAQVPPAMQVHRFTPRLRQSSFGTTGVLNSGTSVTFSPLPNSASPSHSSSMRGPDSAQSNSSAVQAPLHTTPHPRNNPRPSSPPLDNASVLTLASSAFALPNRPGILNYPPSATLGDSVSHYGGSILFPDNESTSHYVLGDDERLEERDFDASVRALRPRSSRRGSWDSETSGWSARVQGGAVTPSLAKAFRTASIHTGRLSTDNAEGSETTEATPATATREIEEESISESKRDVLSEEAPSSTTNEKVSTAGGDGITGTNNSGVGQDLHRSSTDTIGLHAIPQDHTPAVLQRSKEGVAAAA